MVAPIRYLSRREISKELGVTDYSEDKKTLEVVGKVGIGTTIFDVDPGAKLQVNGAIFMAGDVASQLSDGRTGIEIGASSPSAGVGTAHHRIRSAGGSGQNLMFEAQTADVFVPGGDIVFKTGGTNDRLRILKDGNIGIGVRTPTAKLTINPLTTLPVDGTETPASTTQKAIGGVSIANSENKIYPSSNFNATLGLYQENEIGGITTYASGNEFIYGSRNFLVKRNDNTQDIRGLNFTGSETKVIWTDQNTAHQILGERSTIEYLGADANGRTSSYLVADNVFLRPADGATQTINNVVSSNNTIISPSAGINTVNINRLLGVRPSIPYVFNFNSGTHDVNITDLVIYDTASDWGIFGSVGTVTADIDNYYGLRLNAPVNSTGLTITNNYGVYSGWSESKNYFAGDVGIGTDNPTAKLDVDGTLNVSGVSTFQGNVQLLDDDRLQIGGSVGNFDGLELFHIGNNSYITDSGTGNLKILSNKLEIKNAVDDEHLAIFNENGSVDLHYNGVKKFETTGYGVTVFGTTQTQQLNVTGVSTFGGNIGIGTQVDDDNIISVGLGTIFLNGGGDIRFRAKELIGGRNAALRLGKANTSDNSSVDILFHADNGENPRIASRRLIDDGDAARIQFTSDGSFSRKAITFWTKSASSYSADPEERMRITRDGDIGIGTDNPTAKLDVDGTLNVSGVSTFQDNVNLGDNDRLRLGDGNDLQIFHGGSNSFIQDTGTGNLFVAADPDVQITNSSTVQKKAVFNTGGAVELYYDNSKKFETTGAGVTVFGTTQTQQLNVSGVSTFQGNVNLGDNDQIIIGDGPDLKLYHDGSNSIILNNTGNLVIAANKLRINNGNSSLRMIQGDNGGAVSLWYNGDKKFETTGIGVSISNGNSDTATIAAPSNLIIDPAVVGDNTGIVRIKGDLFVDGTTTQINSTTLEIADFIVGIASTATTDLLADGAGIQIGPDNTLLYEHNSGINPSLKSSENLNVASGKGYQINQTEVLNATTLGSGVTNSSLTSVGTLSSLNVSGVSTFGNDVSIADKIIHTGDTDTAIRFPAADTFTVETNGTERFRITSTGAIGIGTNNPGQKLHIVSDGSPVILLEDGSGADQTFARYKSSSGNWSAGADHRDDAFIINKSTNLRTGTPELYVHSIIGVGIGTTNPNSEVKSNNNRIFHAGIVTSRFYYGDGSNLTGLTPGQVGALANIVEDTTPQLGGDLDLNSNDITGTGNIDINGNLNISGVSTFSDNVSIASTNVTSLTINPLTTLSTSGDIGGVSIANTENKTYPTDPSFNVTLGLNQDIEVGGTQVIDPSTPGGFNFISGITNFLVKNNNNTQDIERSNYYGFNQNFDWDDANTCKQYVSIQDGFQYSGIDRNGRTSSFFIANTLSLSPPDGGTQTINNTESKTLFVNSTLNGGISTVNITNASGYVTKAIFTNFTSGTHNRNITNYSAYDTSLQTGTGFGTINATITNYYGLRLNEPINSTGLTVTNNYGVYSGWSESKNYFAGDVGIGTDNPNSAVSSSNNRILHTGIVTSRFYYGDGSNLTGISAGQVGALTDIVFDTTPQLGGNLDLNNKDITGTGNIDITGNLNVSGISTFQSHVHLGDNDELRIGDGNDLQIYHESTFNNSVIKESGSGNLLFGGKNIDFRDANLGDSYALFRDDNTNTSVELYYNDSKKFETTGAGATVFGTTQTQQLNVSGVSTFNDSVDIEGVNSVLDVKEGKIYTTEVQGNNRELYIRGGGSQSTRPTIHLPNTTNPLSILGNSSNTQGIVIDSRSTGVVDIKHNSSTKLQTTGAGVTVFGTTESQQLNVSGVSTFQGDVRITDDDKLRFGTSSGGILQIYTNGTNSFFKQISGDLKYELADQFIVQKDSGDEPIAIFNSDSDVELYYDGSKKFETTGYGVTVFGTTETEHLNVSGIITATESEIAFLQTQYYSRSWPYTNWSNSQKGVTLRTPGQNIIIQAGGAQTTRSYVSLTNGGGAWIGGGYGDPEGVNINAGSGDVKITGGNVGVATTNPTSTLHISGVGSTVNVGISTVELMVPNGAPKVRVGTHHWDEIFSTFHAKDVTSEFWIEQNSDNNDGPDMVFFKSRGVPGTELPVQIGDNLARIGVRGLSTSTTASGVGITLTDYPATASGLEWYVDYISDSGVPSASFNILGRGSRRLTVASGGKVGIGTTLPQTSLHIHQNSPIIRLTDKNQSTDNKSWNIAAHVPQLLRIQAINDANSGGGQVFDFYRSGNQVQKFLGKSGGDYWFVVDNNNERVGIGTTVPAVPLDIRSSTPTLRLYDTDATNGYTNITNINGNMYLGARNNSSDGILLFGGYGGGIFTEFFRASSNGFIVQTNGNERLRVGSTGNVAIGTDAPSGAADTNNTAILNVGVVTANFYYGNGSNLTGLTAGLVGALAGLTIRKEGSAQGGIGSVGDINFVSSNLSATASGVGATITLSDTPSFTKIGIGTDVLDASLQINVGSAVTALDIQGSEGQLFSVTNNLTSGSIFSVNDVSGIPSIDVDANGTILLAPYGINENVGVGTTNPSEKLDVIGTVKATDFNTTSDQNLKTNIHKIENPLEKVVEIRGVNFEWKQNNKSSAGVIAQEVEKVLPELVTDSGTKTVNYNGLIGLLIEVVKEQQEQINSLNSRLSKLE